MADSQLIAIIGGDGIGPEVVAQGVRILEYYRETRREKIERRRTLAEQLGISRRWLTTKMARYRIPRPRKRD